MVFELFQPEKTIENAIRKVLIDLGIAEHIPIPLSFPEDREHGDYTTNVAFMLVKVLKRTPVEIGKELVKKIAKELPFMSIIEVVQPGFINFYFSDDFLMQRMKQLMLQKENIGKTETMKNKKIMVEFTDPNPFKEFHIGHLYSNIVGEAICRLFESQGACVERACYQGDVGLHVAKALWGMLQLHAEMPTDEAPLHDRATFMGKAYALGANAYEEQEVAKKEIITINRKIYEKKDKNIVDLYTKGRQWSLDYFNKIYHRLGTKFNKFYFESEAGTVGLDYVRKHITDGIFEENEGAVIFRGEKYGLHTRVFINSQGLPTYEAKELGLAPTKYKDFHFDESIIITANEINEYFKVLLQVLSLVNPEIAKKTKHVSHGLVKLPSGKMSSRKGNVLTGEWLLNEAKLRAGQKIQEAKHSGAAKEIKNEEVICEQVGTGAVKYALLKASIGRDVEFDFDKSVSFEGNAGPYVQYTYVRTQSLLEKVPSWDNTFTGYLLQPEERDLLRISLQFSRIVTQAAEEMSPNTLCTYLYEVAKNFNLFYQKYRIADAAAQKEINFRLNLSLVIGEILKQGLDFLGIAAPKRM